MTSDHRRLHLHLELNVCVVLIPPALSSICKLGRWSWWTVNMVFLRSGKVMLYGLYLFLLCRVCSFLKERLSQQDKVELGDNSTCWADVIYTWLTSDHNVSQTISRSSMADWLQSILCAFYMSFLPDRISRYRPDVSTRWRWGHLVLWFSSVSELDCSGTGCALLYLLSTHKFTSPGS